jgi:hypothetical protein
MNEKKPSPEQILDHKDPGDETQRNFRYQNGYGAILLIASARGINRIAQFGVNIMMIIFVNEKIIFLMRIK